MHANQVNTDYKHLLSRLCHLVALSKSKNIEGVVDSLIASVIEIDPLYPATDKEKVDEALKVYFGVEIAPEDIELSISRLFGAGVIIRGNEKGTFELSPSGRANQLQRVDDATKLEENVKAQWLESIQDQFQEYTDQIKSELWSCLKAYLTKLFCRHGAQTASIASGKHLSDADLETSIGQLLNSALNETCKTIDRAKAGLAVQRFLREQTADRAKYIAQLLDGTFSFYALFTDEATQNYLKAAIPKITLLLDTNFLFGVLNLHDNPQNQVSKELVSLIRQQRFPFVLYYHEESLREIQETVAQAERRLCQHKWSSALSRAVLRTHAHELSGLELKFHEANSEHQIDPNAYFLKFRQIGKVLDAEGFKIYRMPNKREATANGKEKLDEQTIELIFQYQRFLDDRRPSYKHKGFNTLKHDIVVWQTTKSLQKNGTYGLDVGALMLSADQRLFAFDWGVLRQQDGGVGVVVMPSQLLQLLRPFVPRTEDFDKKFAAVFALPEFRSSGSDFTQITQLVLGYLSTVKDLNEETAVSILADELLLSRLGRVKTDQEIQEAIESEVLSKNAELALLHKDALEKLDEMKSEAAEKQKQFEEAQRSKEQSSNLQVVALQEKVLEKEQQATEANEEVELTKAALTAANDDKRQLEENVRQMANELSELKSQLAINEATSAKNRKIYRVIGGMFLTLSGWVAILLLPAIQNWVWLQTHPHRLSFYLAAMLSVPGLAWVIFAWKGRLWALGSILLAVIIRFIGVL